MRKVVPLLMAALLALAAQAEPVPAAAQGACLSRVDQRAAVRSGDAIRPGQLRRSLGGKMLRLRLCRTAGGLVWQVTTLRKNGRVISHVVDARSGRQIR